MYSLTAIFNSLYCTQDERYKNEPSKEEFPMYESLKLTIERTLPYWNNVIVPQIKYLPLSFFLYSSSQICPGPNIFLHI
jgi:hypothetical protein